MLVICVRRFFFRSSVVRTFILHSRFEIWLGRKARMLVAKIGGFVVVAVRQGIIAMQNCPG